MNRKQKVDFLRRLAKGDATIDEILNQEEVDYSACTDEQLRKIISNFKEFGEDPGKWPAVEIEFAKSLPLKKVFINLK